MDESFGFGLAIGGATQNLSLRPSRFFVLGGGQISLYKLCIKRFFGCSIRGF